MACILCQRAAWPNGSPQRDFQLHGTRLVVLDFTKPIKMKGSRTSAFCFAAYDIMVLWWILSLKKLQWCDLNLTSEQCIYNSLGKQTKREVQLNLLLPCYPCISLAGGTALAGAKSAVTQKNIQKSITPFHYTLNLVNWSKMHSIRHETH